MLRRQPRHGAYASDCCIRFRRADSRRWLFSMPLFIDALPQFAAAIACCAVAATDAAIFTDSRRAIFSLMPLALPFITFCVSIIKMISCR